MFQAAKVRQKAAAVELGVRPDIVSTWVRRRVTIPTQYIKPLSLILGVSSDDVLAVAVALSKHRSARDVPAAENSPAPTA